MRPFVVAFVVAFLSLFGAHQPSPTEAENKKIELRSPTSVDECAYSNLPSGPSTVLTQTLSMTYHQSHPRDNVPTFTFSYPRHLGNPTISFPYDDSIRVAFYVGSTTRYCSQFTVTPMKLGKAQTLEEFAVARIEAADTEAVRYSLSIDGHTSIGQAIWPSSPRTDYYVLLDNTVVLDFAFGRTGPIGSTATMESFRTTTDEIMQSVRFSKSQ